MSRRGSSWSGGGDAYGGGGRGHYDNGGYNGGGGGGRRMNEEPQWRDDNRWRDEGRWGNDHQNDRGGGKGDRRGGKGGGGRRSRTPRSRSRSHSYVNGHRRPRRRTPPAKRGQRWWKDSDTPSFVDTVPNFKVPASLRGRILGDRGSNVKRIVDAVRKAIGHEDSHGRAPFVHCKDCTTDEGEFVEFELQLYEPFDNKDSFDYAVGGFVEIVNEMKERPDNPHSRHCFRPKKIQPDDWECPNIKCGNLCFARRRNCNLCGEAKPAVKEVPFVGRNVPNEIAEQANIARPPKHAMQLTSTKESLGPPPEGQIQVIWLIPLENRGHLIGSGGSTINEMKAQTGAYIKAADPSEIITVASLPFVEVFIRGISDTTKQAVSAVYNLCGGILAQDGFEPLIQAVTASFEGAEHCAFPMKDIAASAEVKGAMDNIRELMRGAGMRTLMELLEQWPGHFQVARAGPEGPTLRMVYVDMADL